MKVLTYDAHNESFSDGCYIDWFLWEPLASIHIESGPKQPQPLSEAHWEARMRLPPVNTTDKFMKLFLPVERHGQQCRSITLPVELSVRQFFTAVHAFYDRPLTAADLGTLCDPPTDFEKRDFGNDMLIDYVRLARREIAAGKCITWSDLLGPRDRCFAGPYSRDTEDRRHPYCCSGLVRYEGIRQRVNRVYLQLGS